MKGGILCKKQSALTIIQDYEDSVAAVDAEGEAIAYGNGPGLMKSDLATIGMLRSFFEMP